MVLELSLLTISSAAFYVAFFMHSFGWGFIVASILHVVWFMIHGAGFILPTDQVFVNYFWSALFFAVLGWVLALILKSPALLNGVYYRKVFSTDHHGRKHKEEDPDLPVEGNVKDDFSAGKAFGKFLIPFLLLVAGHLVYELNISTFPKWVGGLILSLVIVLAWGLFYVLFMDKNNQRSVMFNSRNPKREVATISFDVGLIMLLYSLAYWIFQVADCPGWSSNSPNVTLGSECDLFYDAQWYFLLSLLFAVGVVIWIFAIWMFVRGTKKETDVAYEYKGLKQNTQ
jgi:hypothetical protein